MGSNHVITINLATSPSYLHASLHSIKKPSLLARNLKNDGRLALIKAKRVFSINQLVCAANMAPFCKTWNVVYLSAPSNHMPYVLREYAFLSDEDVVEGDLAEEEMVIIFHLSEKADAMIQILKEMNLLDSIQPNLEEYLNQQGRDCNSEFRNWYKLTDEEVGSIENGILTRIATKML
mmetsp:Transcript_2796/g.4186  ORF Transcript_2796/g.4186 Transcript_2796/m.4186 type:complete len:178 (+) Transcript_2796:105-638(+)|eukprot:CAMPEP_0178916452 /NCGR_PEP_ID=MMETSP0786-20121207/12651_1 /TAXON_ID=186022 /ORGANISM="Thalassionema frauenfeldii, Strain CCMP 1798" /LENGTH=177 /DNA_ID=CAMNT_0020589797 /DNA_START=81 /DNA_END=614 /DNA_ORIENTATION=-